MLNLQGIASQEKLRYIPCIGKISIDIHSLYRQDLTFYYSVLYSDQGAHSETVTKVFTVWKISQVTSDQVANKPSDK